MTRPAARAGEAPTVAQGGATRPAAWAGGEAHALPQGGRAAL